MKQKLEATVFVIFGGSGDLANRKLVPALLNLSLDGDLPDKVAIFGLGRTEYSDEQFRDELRNGIKEFSRRVVSDEVWLEFSRQISYIKSDISDQASYTNIKERIHTLEAQWGILPNIIFYLAVAPSLVETITANLGKSGICNDVDRTRIVVEKPFGHDLQSAKALNKHLTSIFDESQLYRIDHYLGKEAVQNLLVFRFANTLFEPIWNNKYIDHVQITVSESVGVGDRGGYYDQSGALKDMVQNHVLQLLCFTAMEPPVTFDADEIRNKKLDVLKAIQPYEGKEIFNNSARGQYGPGAAGSDQLAYRKEPKVDPKSNTETFAAVKFYLGNWRWQNVPFYLRSGKLMAQKSSQIVVQFKPVPHQVFSGAEDGLSPNRIIISIAPETGIKVRFQAKQIGQQMRLKQEDLIFTYSSEEDIQQPEAYETLLHDVLTGDATLFMRSDEVEAAWKAVMPFVDAWAEKPATDFPNYHPKSWGPEAAARLISADGRHWIN
jgi:glucose-6-phosphate 1-dehydrogenase